jgi:hypothetical protein
MKVWISNYRNHWISPYIILKKVCFWEKNEDVFYDFEDTGKGMYVKVVKLLNPICTAIQTVLDFIHPRFQIVKLDHWDTWSMDHTLAHIIHPMLLQLNETKHGAPYTEDDDVPEYLRSHMAQPKENEWDIDSLHFKRWDWILNEMIWAFEQELKDDDESQFYDHSESRGIKDFNESMEKLKVDREGLEKHQKRKANGFRLFGKYYSGLWD